MPTLRDGVEYQRQIDATYLNQVSAEGWEILSVIEKGRASTLILVRGQTER
jgi:hypothetical protein